jgi:hypothetical protein
MDESTDFLQALLNEGSETLEMITNLEKVWQVNAVKMHANRLDTNVSPSALYFLLLFTNGNIGTMVMYLHALKRMQIITECTINMNLIVRAFPMGFPLKADLHVIWDEQKLKQEDREVGMGDNYLDTVSA